MDLGSLAEYDRQDFVSILAMLQGSAGKPAGVGGVHARHVPLHSEARKWHAAGHSYLLSCLDSLFYAQQSTLNPAN